MTDDADGTDRTHDPTGTDHADGAHWRDEAESALADVTGALHAAWDSSRQARVEALEAARGALLHLGTAVDQAASAARTAWDDREDHDEAPESPPSESPPSESPPSASPPSASPPSASPPSASPNDPSATPPHAPPLKEPS